MPAKNQVTLTFAGDADQLDKAAARAAKATAGVGDAAAGAGKQSKEAAKATADYTGHMAKLSVITTGVSGAIDQAGGLISGLSDIQNQAKERAAAHARALLDVEQAGLDAKQATRDLAQATLDLKQAQIDATQAAADVSQAQLDQKQALLDVQAAQKDYADAVKENGKGSLEAKQALQDLAQAQQDLKQAGIDVTQAQQDQKQATEDAKQAQQDASQATLDGKTAMQDMADAQRDATATTSGWRTDLDTAIGVASGLAGTIGLLTIATDAFKASTIASTAATVASTVAKGATAVATGVVTAAQWAWNVAMTANPIGLIVMAIGLLVGAVVLIATKTRWFQTAWSASWNAIKVAFRFVKDFVVDHIKLLVSVVTGIPDRIVKALGNVGRMLFDAGKHIIQGLIDGITDKVKALKDKMSSVASSIRDHLPFSPAKVGPLSGSGNPFLSGQKIATMLADGITSRTQVVANAAQMMSAAVAAPMNASTGIVAAAKEILARIKSGGRFDEDLSFKGYSKNLAKYNDPLADIIYGQYLPKGYDFNASGGLGSDQTRAAYIEALTRFLQDSSSPTMQQPTVNLTISDSGPGGFASMFLEAVRKGQIKLTIQNGRVAVAGG